MAYYPPMSIESALSPFVPMPMTVDPFFRSMLPMMGPEMLAVQPLPETSSSLTNYNIGKDGFKASIDVHQFKPEEITVKTVDQKLIIEGRHEEKDDGHGLISRHFVRKYTLPKGYDANAIKSTLSSDGILSVRAPPPKKETKEIRSIPIEKTGPMRDAIKQGPKKDK